MGSELIFELEKGIAGGSFDANEVSVDPLHDLGQIKLVGFQIQYTVKLDHTVAHLGIVISESS